MLHQITRCSAPCVGRRSQDDYAELVAAAEAFLSGRSSAVQRKLGEAMEAASANLDFALAAVYRDRLKALTYIQGGQAVNAEGTADADVIALAGKGGAMGRPGVRQKERSVGTRVIGQ